MANIAVGFQKKFDVKSVYDTILTSVFDTAIQSEFQLPSAHGFRYSALRATVLAVENMGEQYVAASITGGSRHLDDLLANALGTAVQSVMTDIMPKGYGQTEEPKQSKSRRRPITSSGHAQQHIKNDKQGLGIDYVKSVSSAHGEPGVHKGLPEPPGAWQEKGLKSISSSGNRPVTSTNQVHSQPYTHMDTYHHAVQAANDVLDCIHKIENSVEHLWHTATANQHQAAPLTPAHAAHGGIQSSRVGHANEIPSAFVMGPDGVPMRIWGKTQEQAYQQHLQQGVEVRQELKGYAKAIGSAAVTFAKSSATQSLDPKGAASIQAWQSELESPDHALHLNTPAEVRGAMAFEITSSVALSMFGGVEAAPAIESGVYKASKWTASLWGRGSSGAEKTVFHTVTSARGGQGVLDAINPDFFNPNTRFGEAFYISEVPDTNLVELAHHNAIGVDTIRFNFNSKTAKILDLTKPRIAKRWGYVGGNNYDLSQAIAKKAAGSGFNAIRFPSERGLGANLAVFDNFDTLLSPQMIVPVSEDLFTEIATQGLK